VATVESLQKGSAAGNLRNAADVYWIDVQRWKFRPISIVIPVER